MLYQLDFVIGKNETARFQFSCHLWLKMVPGNHKTIFRQRYFQLC